MYICLAVFLSEAAAEYDFHGLGGLGGLHGYHGLGGPLLAPSLLKAPVIPAPTIIKAIAPAPAPIYAHAPAPIYQHAPEPIYAHAPVIKAVAPATSYATVTQVHVTHPAPLVKVIFLFLVSNLYNNLRFRLLWLLLP